MIKFETYLEIKEKLKENIDKQFDEIFEEGFYDSLNLVNEIILLSHRLLP